MKVISELRKIPSPAGFMLRLEKSPPRAPKAPPILVKRAVPPGFMKEYLKASFSFCENACAESIRRVVKAKTILFIISAF